MSQFFLSILTSQWFTYAVLILIALLIISLIAGIIRFVLRFIFKQIRFVVCLALALVIVLFITGRFASSPIHKDSETPQGTQAVALAAEQFKGVYAKELPLLAWRFDEVTNQDLNADGESTDTASQNGGEDEPVLIRVQYLPVGEIVLSYDASNNSFSLAQGLDAGQTGQLITTLFQGAGRNILNSLPKVSN